MHKRVSNRMRNREDNKGPWKGIHSRAKQFAGGGETCASSSIPSGRASILPHFEVLSSLSSSRSVPHDHRTPARCAASCCSPCVFQAAEKLAKGAVAQSVVKMIKLWRRTPYSEPDGEVRGIVAGDVVRRLVARTVACWAEPWTPPLHHTSTHSPPRHVASFSVDGVSAFDPISRGAIMQWATDGGKRKCGVAIRQYVLRVTFGVFVRRFLWHCARHPTGGPPHATIVQDEGLEVVSGQL